MSVAVGELADGLDIDLDAVPKKYEGLDGTELAISESQERMAVVVEEKDVAAFCALAAGENLEATVIATVTKAPRLIMRWRGKTIVDISRAFLNTNGAEKHICVDVKAGEAYERSAPASFGEGMRTSSSPAKGVLLPPLKKKVTWAYFSLSARCSCVFPASERTCARPICTLEGAKAIGR